MVQLSELLAYCNELLQVESYQDYAPNGLQVEGRREVGRIVSGVTACQALIDAAVAERADLLLVHHGYFWRGEAPQITGVKYRRLKALLTHDIGLLAYHLPLDGHAELGNNARLADLMGVPIDGRFGAQQLAMHGTLPTETGAESLAGRLEAVLQRPPLHIPGGAGKIRRIGWCSGGAHGYLQEAAELGLDAFVTGEINEPSVHMAREMGVHLFAAGHHATERYGVQALGDYIAKVFDLAHKFIDIDNPI